MKRINQQPQKGDPMLRLELPGTTLQNLKASAKRNKRRLQDQFIKALAETFKNEEAFASAFEKLLPDLKEVYQKGVRK